jgi:hypothetical protein
MLSSSLRTTLATLPIGGRIVDSEEFRVITSALEHFIHGVLREIHPRLESLDWLLPFVARKVGDAEAEIFGLAILISDQTLTPFHVRVQLAVADDEVSWIECRLGERGEDGMVRMPYGSPGKLTKHVYALEDGLDRIDWVYKVTFGQRRAE